ncbi:hypothetical protein D8674_016632 [Pyrus ussuriensis x Pyrus communis]|uniref:Uncharacterized protein n=1 Tax=Pyrus ussuriensis x Pyrus communis TaxID=2448454 RepID=A0A5N5GYS1_9ROSA|nr:hypothetical protein D8674_043008 [Pyrus ussuriensis x Pyrus communis]KAB2624972.1 hypothetical protein D8674_016632 [Pyrus ussuriensis x Pyrus communis]
MAASTAKDTHIDIDLHEPLTTPFVTEIEVEDYGELSAGGGSAVEQNGSCGSHRCGRRFG